MNALMVQATCSSAGKSLIVTGLARWFARRGVAVAPFKAQNMSNNARVVRGGEIGVAQYLQALAAGIEPDVRMNPVLVKPEGDTRSQVVVLGRANAEISALPWMERAPVLWQGVEAALRALQAEYELLLIEGAGSPAEINLSRSDLANMRTARAAQARVFLVADIDRGGAFAHLYGTWRLIEKRDRRKLRGFILNKFRGELRLLEPAPALLQRQTGIRTIGVGPGSTTTSRTRTARAAAARAGRGRGSRSSATRRPRTWTSSAGSSRWRTSSGPDVPRRSSMLSS